jgi:hypothetical protein
LFIAVVANGDYEVVLVEDDAEAVLEAEIAVLSVLAECGFDAGVRHGVDVFGEGVVLGFDGETCKFDIFGKFGVVG